MLGRFLKDTKKYFGYTLDSTKAKLKAEVANSYLNWIWWVLEPLCFMGIFYLVFGVFFNMREQYFIAFIMLGYGIWTFFNHMMQNSVTIMRTNKPIVSKVYLPKHILLLERVGVNGFKMLIQFGIVVVIMIFSQVPVTWRLVLVIPILITMLLFTFAISCFLLHFGVYVADLKNIVTIVLRLLFYISGIFYSIPHRVPAPFGDVVVNVNPMAFIINSMRQCVLYSTTPDMLILAGWFVLSVILCVLGIRLVYRNENSYVKSI